MTATQKWAALAALLAARWAYEGRVAEAALRDWRACAAGVALTAAAVGYWLTPDDLIPDSVYFWGRVDDVAVILLCMAMLRWAAAAAARPQLAESVRTAWRLAAVRAASVLVGPWLYEALFETRPDAAELLAFQDGVWAAEEHLPPLLRGFGSVPRARLMVQRLLRETYAPEGAGGVTGLLPPALGRQPASPLLGDPLTVWVGPKVGFLHFEKAAGTSFAEALTALFHPMQIDADPFRSMPPHVVCRAVPAALARVAEMPLVWGHYDLPYLAALGGGRVLCTVLREPRARLLSLYHYWRSVRPEVLAAEDGNHTLHLAHGLDLAAFLACDDLMLIDYLDNCYVRRLTGRYATGGYVTLPADSLACALAALDCFDLVGVTEDLDWALTAFGRRLCGRALVAPRSNVTVEAGRADVRFRPVPPPVPDEEAERHLDRLTHLDREVYAAAKARQR